MTPEALTIPFPVLLVLAVVWLAAGISVIWRLVRRAGRSDRRQ